MAYIAPGILDPSGEFDRLQAASRGGSPGGFLNRLFPVSDYGGLLDPRAIQRQGLLALGTNLLQAGGRSPNQRGTLANIGSALQSVNIPDMVQTAMRMRAAQEQFTTQRDARAALDRIAKKYPPAEGETPDATYARVAKIVGELVGVPGTEDLIGKYSNVLAQLRPQREVRDRYVFKTIPEGNGRWGQYRVNVDDPTEQIRIGDAQPPATAEGQNLLREKAAAGARTAIESIDDAEKLLVGDPTADVLPLGAALARGAKAGGGVLGTLAGAAEPLAQRSMTPNQQQFQADMQRMVHSMVGLLPGSRQSIVLFNSLVNAYTPQPGEAAQVRTAKRNARQRAREWLRAVQQGKKVALLPELAEHGITEADLELPSGADEARPESPAAPATPPSPGAAPAGYNPKFWRQP